MDLTGNANIQGNIVLGGNITIGDSSSDTIAFGGDVSTDIIPNANNTLDLGSSTDKFAEVHATSLFGTLTGAVNATNNIVSSSSDTANVNITIADGVVSAELYGGVVSGSSQISADQTDGWAADVKTQLNSNTVISGSSQVSYTGLSGIPGGIVSGSEQVNADSITNFDSNVKTKLDVME